MIFLESIIVNVIIIVLCMYIDRYILHNFCKNNPILDGIFKVWLVATFMSVAYVLITILSGVEVVVL